MPKLGLHIIRFSLVQSFKNIVCWGCFVFSANEIVYHVFVVSGQSGSVIDAFCLPDEFDLNRLLTEFIHSFVTVRICRSFIMPNVVDMIGQRIAQYFFCDKMLNN